MDEHSDLEPRFCWGESFVVGQRWRNEFEDVRALKLVGTKLQTVCFHATTQEADSS